MKENLIKIFFLLYVFSVFLAPVALFAQGAVPAPCDQSGKICNPIKADSVNGLIKTILEGVLKIGMPIVALAIIYCGFLFVAARGNSEKITKAKRALLYTLLGAAIPPAPSALAQMITETVLAL